MALVAYDESDDSDNQTASNKKPVPKQNILLSVPTCDSSDEEDSEHFKRILNKSENKLSLKRKETKSGLTSILPKPRISAGDNTRLLIPNSVKRNFNEAGDTHDSVPFFSFVDKSEIESENKISEKEIEPPRVPERPKFGYGMYKIQSVESQEFNPQLNESEIIDSNDSQVEFLMAGGKRKRTVPADNILDINQTDLLGDFELTQSKRLTEEAEYPIKVSKGNQPSGQQRRKHQLTYLAFQAKQRDLELRNQWAANRATQRETRKKYGF